MTGITALPSGVLSTAKASVNLPSVNTDLPSSNLISSTIDAMYRISYYFVGTFSMGDTLPQLSVTYFDKVTGSITTPLTGGGVLIVGSPAASTISFALTGGVYTNGSLYYINIIVEELV